MAKHKHEEHDNHERWLVSYADFITLLFAFFVVMYALSSVSEGKYRVLSDSLGAAFGSRGIEHPPPSAQPLPRELPPRRIIKPADPQARQREQMRGMAQ